MSQLFHQHAQQVLSSFKSLSPTYTVHERIAISLAQVAAARPSLAAVTWLHSIYSIASPMCFTAEKIRLRDLAAKTPHMLTNTVSDLTPVASSLHEPNEESDPTSAVLNNLNDNHELTAVIQPWELEGTGEPGDDPTFDFDDENGPEDPFDDGGDEPDDVDSDLNEDPEIADAANNHGQPEPLPEPFKCSQCSDPAPHIHTAPPTPPTPPSYVYCSRCRRMTNTPSRINGMCQPCWSALEALAKPSVPAAPVPPLHIPDDLDVGTTDSLDDACEQCGTYVNGGNLCDRCRNELV